jgi:hypothetical protein
MEFNPRFVFERLFGSGDTAEERLSRMRQDRSILDKIIDEVAHLRTSLGVRDKAKLTEYLEGIRDVERRIEKFEGFNSDLPVPDRPSGIPSTIKDHATLMFDLQALAFQADITRVTTFMLARESSNVTFKEIGISEAHHAVSHHGNNPEKVAMYAKINAYHIQMFASFLEKLKLTHDGDGSLLDHSLILYGGGMSNGNAHSPFDLPVLVAGGGVSTIKGGRHVRYPERTPMANLLLTLLEKVGLQVDKLGDSTGKLDLLSDI